MVWTPTRLRKKVAKKGYKVMARAGMIGLANILDMEINDTSVPKLSTTAI